MLHIPNEQIPLSSDESGSIYIAGTRVTLDCVVEMFQDNASAEEIVEQYDGLQLADVYAVITYILRHQDEVRGHLAGQNATSEQRREAVDRKFPTNLRTKLMQAVRKQARDDG